MRACRSAESSNPPKDPTHSKSCLHRLQSMITPAHYHLMLETFRPFNGNTLNSPHGGISIEYADIRWMFGLSWCLARSRGDPVPSSPRCSLVYFEITCSTMYVSYRSAVNRAPVEPASPRGAAPKTGVDVTAVVQLLAHCTDDDVHDVEQCVEAMTLVSTLGLTIH